MNTAWRLMLSTVLACALFAVPLSAEDAAPAYQPVQAELFRPRDGMGNVLAKLQAGKDVRIAYLGGSITAAAGWRVKSREWFAREFPQADVSEINAAIGGTGSDLGVFRLEHDALAHKPDLLFVEFAVNDGGASPQRIWQAMEGIVRQTWRTDPRIDICFVYTFRIGYEKDLDQGMCPRAASAMEMLADHYGIPSVNFAVRVVQMQHEGKLIYQSDEPPPDGVIQFSRDGVHPLDEGHQIYTEVLADAVRKMRSGSQPMDHRAKLQGCFVADHWEAAKMVPLQPDMLSGNWKKLPDDHPLARNFGGRMGQLWEADEPGSRIAFRFRGSQAKLYDLLGPDGGQVVIRVDGKERDRPVPRFDSYCTYHRIATLPIADGLDPNETHTVSIEIHPEQPDRTPVAFRLQNPDEELKAEKYQGTYIRASQILLLGDLAD
ncbi:MAG: GDSL-type esterase/lipase family protein [Planctomycetes bacterium]|nr:GDSL-type esterase/lipase family protein [Planctomycetota bacterium]